MPKLNAETAKQVDKAEDGFKPIPDGVYVLELMQDVEVAEGPSGTYWKWTFQIPEDADEFGGRRFWMNTSLSSAAFWKLKETFQAFGVATDADTEDLVKKRVKGIIINTVIQKGPKKGQERNEIDKLMPLDSKDEGPATGKGGGSDDEPMF